MAVGRRRLGRRVARLCRGRPARAGTAGSGAASGGAGPAASRYPRDAGGRAADLAPPVSAVDDSGPGS